MAYLFAFIDGAIWDLDVTIINVKSGKIVKKLQPRANKKFVASIPSIFSPKKFKAIIYNVGRCEGHDYPNLLEFRKAIKEKLDKLKIPNHYFTKDRYNPTQCLVPANISAKDGDYVIVVMGSKNIVYVTVIKFTTNGWKMISDEPFHTMLYFSNESMRKKILGSYKPKNVILTAANFADPTPKYLIDILKPLPNLIVIDRRDSFAETILEIYKNLMDNKYIKNYVIPTLEEEEYELGFKKNGSNNEKCKKIVVKMGEFLPFSKSFFVPHSSNEFYLTCTDAKTKKILKTDTFMLKKDCHQNKITLTVDGETVATYEVKPIVFDGIKELPSTLTELNFDKKIPVIGLYDNCSVICVPKNDAENEYKFLNGWNGMYGKQLLIAFDKKEPKYCDDAEEVFQKKPTFVITDLINIISLTLEELKEQSATWKFKITQDSENPILLEFDNFDGTKKAATPQFLLAMLLKEHCKEIKKEMGWEKPKALRFCLFPPHSEVEEERKKKIEKGIEESCKLIKIECSFFEV
uniref:Uncharacterized protein n=1 Tax=Panagrolaimus sp. PS1159 TaxID=55785 RepID=A0AC35G7Z1_9BILA